MSDENMEKEVIVDVEDEKETIEVDLESAGLTGKNKGDVDMEDELKEFSSRLEDLEEEKEEILRRVSMSIGDSKLALENSDRSIKDIKQLKKEVKKTISKFEKVVDKSIEKSSLGEKALKEVEKLESDIKMLKESLSSLEEGIGKSEEITKIKDEFGDLKKTYKDKISTVEDKMARLKGFLATNLDELEQKFSGFREDIAEKFDKVDERVGENLAGKVSELEDKFKSTVEEMKKDLEEVKKVQSSAESALNIIEEMEKKEQVQEKKIEDLFSSIGQMEEKLDARIAEHENKFNTKLSEHEEKIKEATDKINDIITERVDEIDNRLGELREKMEREIHEKLEPLRNEVKDVSGDLDEKLKPFRDEIESAKTHLEEELIKVKDSWKKLDEAVSESGGAMEIAQKAKESLQKMEEEIISSIEKLDQLMTNIRENTLKTDSNYEKISLTVKLIDEARERIKGIQAPSPQAVAAIAAGAPEYEGELLFTQQEILEPPDTSELGFELDDLLQVMIKHEASDLHIKSGSPPTVRMEGELIPVGSQILTDDDCKRLILSAMNQYQRRQLAKRMEVDFAYAIPTARFRVNAFLQKQSVSASFRLLRTEIPTIEELNLPEILKKLSDHNHGLILVTGPAGSGKSTTLASMINYINENKKMHIITIEDPIEFVHQDKMSIITQREVGTDTESFAVALKQALRQDPNVILIGEMRDPETIMTAVIAAETGHLVLSTLHTPNTIQAINRIIDVFSGDTQKQFRLLLSNTLRGVVSQRLLNRTDEGGRIPAVEVMVVTPTIASLVLEEKTNEIYSHMVQGGTEGMQTFTQSLTELFEKGLVSKEEAMYHADQPTEFRLSIEGHTTGSSTIQEDSLMSWL